VAKAAATAGTAFRELPPGTEYVYPSVARIGNGPVVTWQWRTDLVPRFQPVKPNTVLFDPSSEEGEMLIRWGFEPRVLAYIPNVRGVFHRYPGESVARTSESPDQAPGGSRGAASEALVSVQRVVLG
jgi:hypothetical protein